MNRSLVFVALYLLFAPFIQAETKDWKLSPNCTFVFELNAGQVENLFRYANDKKQLTETLFLLRPVAAFTDEHEWERNERPAEGHFVYANLYKDQVTLRYAPVMPFQVFLFQEYGHLTLQVMDADGNIRPDAKVRIKNFHLADPQKAYKEYYDTWIDFDHVTQTYTVAEKSYQRERILTVELDGFTVFLDLRKRFPYRNRSYSGWRNHSAPDFYSYMIADKNKYKPGENIRFKSYALNTHREPLKSELDLWLHKGYNDRKFIQKVNSNHPGNYTGEFLLHDSLEIRLDQNYTLQLADKKGRIVGTTYFRYEDYELFDNTVEVKLATNRHFHPETNSVQIHATDANGLTLPDAHAEVTITSSGVNKIFDNLYILPDTVLRESLQLVNDGPTEVNIPAYLFGKANMSYRVQVVVKTPDNQPLIRELNAVFYYENNEIVSYPEGSMVKFELLKRGQPAEQQALLYYDDEVTPHEITLPYTIPFEQYRKQYIVKVPGLNISKVITPSGLVREVELKGGFASGNFSVKAENPLGIEFSWYIYEGAQLVRKGFGKELDETIPDVNMDYVYFVELFYRLGEEDEYTREGFSPAKKNLQIETNLPDRVYPGQEIETTIRIKDMHGNPLKNVDLTALAYNKLLDYYLPDLPYYGSPVTGRGEKPTYELDEPEATATIPLDYEYWNQYARLDTMDYFRFSYPLGKIFVYTEAAPDSLTQFAPFVMHKGKLVRVYVIECDDKPVWFSWTNHIQGYSFPVPTSPSLSIHLNKEEPMIDTAYIIPAKEYHKITLRLHDRVLTIDSVYFEPGKKTILSIDRDSLPENSKQLHIPDQSRYKNQEFYTFTAKEREKYSTLISEIPVRTGDHYTWLKRGDKIYPVHFRYDSRQSEKVLYGPFTPGRTSYMNGVEYMHHGSYSYDYEPNVVYKYPLGTGFPKQLHFLRADNLLHLHDFHITADSIQRKIEMTPVTEWYTQPTQFSVFRPGLKLQLELEKIKIKSQIAGVVFCDKETGKTIFHPKELTLGKEINKTLPVGTYTIYLLYENGEYRLTENIPVSPGCYIYNKMYENPILPANEESKEWLEQFELMRLNFNLNREPQNNYSVRTYEQSWIMGDKIEGIVVDAEGEPIIGLSVVVKDTTCGTITDIDGKFTLNLYGLPEKDTYQLQFTYIGMQTTEVEAYPNTHIQVVMEEDYQMLEETVVIGYGTQRKSMVTGAISTVSYDSYGALPAPAHEISSDDDSSQQAEEQLYQELLMLSGLRRNFSDVGFWQPVLYTDKKGEASFKVTIPDNITQWNAVVYAMNRKLQTGTLRHNIKSYKPLMGELKMPRFLVQGDSVRAVATIRNYTQDKQIEGSLIYSVNGDTIQSAPVSMEALWQRRLPLNPASADSLTATFLFIRNDGYKDGEERTIPVVPIGTLIADGDLRILKNGEQVELETRPGEEVHVRLSGNALDVYADVASYLMGYQYACNEQLASKLVGLLQYKIYIEYQGKKFRYDKQVNEIIARLLRNQNAEQLWSWWGNNEATSFWMSAHIMRSLKMAQDAGYKVNVQLKWAKNDYLETLPYRYGSLEDIEILHVLSLWGLPQEYEKIVEYFEEDIRKREIAEREIKVKKSYLKHKLLLWEIRQQQGLTFERDSLMPYLHKTTTGQIYCDDHINNNWRNNRLAKTLIAYRLIRNDSILYTMKEQMQMYILSTRTRYWNTYQSATIISTLMPDLIAEGSKAKTPVRVVLSGKENREHTTMEYETILRDGETLKIEKKAGVPLIYSSWIYKLETAGYSTDAFDISTRFEEDENRLKAGTPVSLIVDVEVKEENSEYVMIEVPVPAGCSYASKTQFYQYEVHREYFKEKTVIFCRQLGKGKYTFTIDLLPRFTGTYHLNPAKVELMYLPAINAMNDLRKVKIEEPVD